MGLASISTCLRPVCAALHQSPGAPLRAQVVSDRQAGMASRGLFINWEEVSLEEKYEGGIDTAGSSRRETDILRQLCIDVAF